MFSKSWLSLGEHVAVTSYFPCEQNGCSILKLHKRKYGASIQLTRDCLDEEKNFYISHVYFRSLLNPQDTRLLAFYCRV